MSYAKANCILDTHILPKVTGFDFAYLTNPNDATVKGNINPWQSLIQGPVPGFAPPVSYLP